MLVMLHVRFCNSSCSPDSQPFLEIVFGGGKRARRSDIPVSVLEALNNDKTKRGQEIVLLVQVGLLKNLKLFRPFSSLAVARYWNESYNGKQICCSF